MPNPFEQRATEYIRDDHAFLEIVTPDPLFSFFKKPAAEGRLFDRLVKVAGTPGSGKTTIAMMIEFKRMNIVRRDPQHESYKPIVQAMTECGLISESWPTVVAVRLPMESEYRDYWELPYDESIRNGLVKSLVQARAVIGWMRALQNAFGVGHNDIEFMTHRETDAALTNIGGGASAGIWEHAIRVEQEVYDVGAGLIPPPVETLGDHAKGAYWPFDVLDQMRVHIPDSSTTLMLRPLVILDDAHTLHQSQYQDIETWLMRREMRIARWIMTRQDREPLQEILHANSSNETASLGDLNNPLRETTVIHMQGTDLKSEKKRFRLMARNMADRKLARLDTFRRRNIQGLADLLSEEPPTLSQSQIRKLKDDVKKTQHKLSIGSERRILLEKDIDAYFSGSTNLDNGEDVRLSLLRILMHRYANRVQKSLFGDELNEDPTKPIKIKAGMVHGARFQLLHSHNRPRYYGFNAIADGSSQNAELFLHLASPIVSLIETRIIRGKQASLDCKIQNEIIREQAHKIVRNWSFPESRWVRKLIDKIGAECVEGTLEPTAPLADGPNAFGILQEEFDEIPDKYPKLANILKYGAAYNAITLVPSYPVKYKKWCLIELGGCACIHYGITLSRGNFLERTVPDLLKALKKSEA